MLGDTLECPCCLSRLAQFDPFRHKPHYPWRENAKCPVCGSMERHRRLWFRFMETPGLFENPSKMLHIAPEPFLRRIFSGCSNIDYLDCDLQETRAGSRIDISSLPFDSDQYDWIICSHVLEHVRDDWAALSELHRVLKPGGTGFFMVPILKCDTMYHQPPPGGFTPDDHIRDYGLPGFLRRLTHAGFAIRHESPRDIPPERKKRFRLSNHIFVCGK